MSRLVIYFARAVSFIAALAVTVTVLVFPRLIALDMHTVPHGWLVVLMLGMSFGYVHGIGFIPKNPILKTLFSPVVAWPLMLLGSLMTFGN